MRRASSGTRSPVGVPPRLLPGGSRPFRSAPGQASRDAARAHDPQNPPDPGRRPCATKRVLPAPACPSPGKAPPAPAVIPARMMPGAARERSVSFRARAPLSLRFREYPRPKASPRFERDSQFVAKIVTIVKCVPDTGTLKFTFRAVATVAPKCRSNWLIGQHSHSSSTGSVLQCIHSWWLHC